MFKKLISLFVAMTIVFSLTSVSFAVVSPVLELDENTVYFDNIDNNIAEGYLEPQIISFIENEGEWYKIETMEGYKWINPNIITTELKLLENTYYYEGKDPSSPLGYFEPQNVIVLQKDGDWHRIQTSKGPKWINPNYIVENLERLDLRKPTYYFEEKEGTEPLGFFEPQEVTVLESDGDWFLISTSEGPKWVNPDIGPNELKLDKNTYYFDNKSDLIPLGYFAPQIVDVIESDGNWYKINTVLGPKWIDINYVPDNNIDEFYFESFSDINDYIAYPSIDKWSLGESLINTASGENRFYIPYSNEEYFVRVKAQLSESTGLYGYSIIVDADVDSSGKDYTGYSIQFDKGEDAIILRERNGSSGAGESNILDRIDLQDMPNSWWHEVHDFRVDVKNSLTDSSKKEITVYIDGTSLNENEPFIIDNYDQYTRTRAIGLRTWNSTIAEFFTIEAGILESTNQETIPLTENTYYYENIGDENYLGYFEPQDVVVLDKDGEWYQISTYAGPMWIIPNDGPEEEEPPQDTIPLIKNTYYYENINDDNALGYFAPQNVVVLDKDGEWYQISTYAGPMWIIPNDGPEEEEPPQDTIPLIKNTYYYENINDDNALGYFAPQNVVVLDKDGEWYQISTYAGPMWIIPNYGPEDEIENAVIDVSVIFEGWVDNGDGTYDAYFGYENNSTLDGEPFIVPYEPGSEFNKFDKAEYNELLPNMFGYPQVIDGRPGRTDWFPNAPVIVRNWDGTNLVWTGPNGTATASLAPGLEKELEEGNDYSIIDLKFYTYYYDNINDEEPLGYFAPQEVIVLDQDEDDWYLIQTSLGDKWIKLYNGPQILITEENLSYFDQKDDSNPLGYFEPQTFIVTNQDDDWYKVLTNSGQKWINLNIIAQVVEPINTIRLEEYTYYYDNKEDEQYQGYFDPQVVNVIESDGDWYKISTGLGPKWININNTLSLLKLNQNTYYYKQKTDVVPKGYFAPQTVIVLEEEGDWKLIQSSRGPRWINTIENNGMPTVTSGMVMIYKGSEYELIDVDILKSEFDLNTVISENGWDRLLNGSLYVPPTAGDIETKDSILWNVPGDIELDTSIIFKQANTTVNITSQNGDFVFHKNNSITGKNSGIRPYVINLVSQNGYLKLNETTIETKPNGNGIIKLVGSEFVKFESANITSKGDKGLEVISYGYIKGKNSNIESTNASKLINFTANGYIDVTGASVISKGPLSFNASDDIFADNGYFESNGWGNKIEFTSNVEDILYVDGASFSSHKPEDKPYTNMIVMPTERADDFVY